MASLEHRELVFLNQIIKKFGNDSWEVLSKYKSSRKPLIFKCKKCGSQINQTPSAFLTKTQCKKCYHNKQKYSTSVFIEKAKNIHQNKFDYSFVDYVSSKQKVKIICNKHSIVFFQEPRNHLSGHGCKQCTSEKLSAPLLKNTEIFVKNATIIHNNKYCYNNTNYINNNVKVEIFCNKCEKPFYQQPRNHISGFGCPYCSNSSISKVETRWLDFLNIPRQQRQKTLKISNATYKVDALDEQSKTIYEFYGDYWHGNPNVFQPNDYNIMSKKTFGELYDKTISRQQELINYGYKVVFIWENEFYKNFGRK